MKPSVSPKKRPQLVYLEGEDLYAREEGLAGHKLKLMLLPLDKLQAAVEEDEELVLRDPSGHQVRVRVEGVYVRVIDLPGPPAPPQPPHDRPVA